MRALLDTHTFLWWVTNTPQLSETVRSILADQRNQIFFSAASGWEIAIKAQLGKLEILVINRRIQGLRRRCKKPSMTICPAKVAVSVELCPKASKAKPKTALAAWTPNKGESNL